MLWTAFQFIPLPSLRTDRVGTALYGIASGAADPTLANGNQGPLLLTAKARAPPSVEEASAEEAEVAPNCA